MRKSIIILLFFLSFGSCADTNNRKDMYEPCFSMAEKDSGIKKELLKSIAQVESNQNHLAIGSNSPRKGFGIGLMQIDSQHLQYFKKKYGVNAEDLLINECLNIYAGALILKKSFIQQGATWDGVGAYNAGFRKNGTQEMRRSEYAKKVKRAYYNQKNRQVTEP